MPDVSRIKLADALGVTLQQMQKYENGANRRSASRLKQISTYLQAPDRRDQQCGDLVLQVVRGMRKLIREGCLLTLKEDCLRIRHTRAAHGRRVKRWRSGRPPLEAAFSDVLAAIDASPPNLPAIWKNRRRGLPHGIII